MASAGTVRGLIAGYLLVQSSLLAQSTGTSASTCEVAQLLFVTGTWIVDPGARTLTKWQCLQFDDEIHIKAPAIPPESAPPPKKKKHRNGKPENSPPPPAPEGEITIIYRVNNIPPYHLVCDSASPCRNAYKVSSSAKSDTPSLIQDILDIFFSHPQPRIVPGILTGQASHEFMGTRSFGLSGEIALIGRRSFRRRPNMTPIVLCSDAGKIDIRQIPFVARESGDTTVLRLGNGQTTQFSSPSIDVTPSKLFLVATSTSSAVALIEPRNSCSAASEQLGRAVVLTQTWPSGISESTKIEFLDLFLENLASTDAK